MRKRWGLALVLALVCVVLLCVGVSAETVAEGVCGDDLTWVLDDAGVLTISGSGEMEDYKSGSITPWYSYRNDITTVIIEEGVTSVGNHAFDNFDTINCFYPLLTSVQLPGTLGICVILLCWRYFYHASRGSFRHQAMCFSELHRTYLPCTSRRSHFYRQCCIQKL